MKYIITGVSRGLGKAIAERCLADGHMLIGVGRRHSIEHPNFRFVECDLSDMSAVQVCLKDQTYDEPVTLINNAGIIGEIGRLSQQEELTLETVMDVNVNAPILLMNTIYRNTTSKDDFSIVNISSGAASRAIPSWASYCASKAALNMLTEAFYLEEQELGNSVKAYAVAPGVIDTGMQEQIRAASQETFSAVENFKGMKKDGVLFSSEDAANRLIQLLKQPYLGEVFHDLRNVNP